METDLAVARGLRNFLLRKKPDVDAFFAELARLQRWRRSGGRPEDAIGRAIVATISPRSVERFLGSGRSPTASQPLLADVDAR